MPSSSAPGEHRLALASGVGCYLMWGIMPLAFQLMGRLGISDWKILANRCVWAVPMGLLFVLAARQVQRAVAAVRRPRVLGSLAVSAVLIAINWTTYIWAVNDGRVLEASLGYYLTPLLLMAAGAVLFGERIDPIGVVAIVLAGLGVALQALALGRLPWVSLVVGVSFTAYGVVRKRVQVDAQAGFLIETLLLAGPALAYVLWLQHAGVSHLTAGGSTTWWLLACGPITAVPLVLFAWAARRIPMTTVGFLQFIAPTIGFVIGLSEGEAFTPMRALSFVFIWSGAMVFLAGAVKRASVARLAAQSAA